MGLYLCIFDGDEDVDGVDVGAYADHNALRDYIVCELEAGEAESRFPTFIAWQETVAKSIGLDPQNAFESFIDVDGEFLLERLQSLVKNALAGGCQSCFSRCPAQS